MQLLLASWVFFKCSLQLSKVTLFPQVTIDIYIRSLWNVLKAAGNFLGILLDIKQSRIFRRLGHLLNTQKGFHLILEPVRICYPAFSLEVHCLQLHFLLRHTLHQLHTDNSLCYNPSLFPHCQGVKPLCTKVDGKPLMDWVKE